jgi:hypothetical protein
MTTKKRSLKDASFFSLTEFEMHAVLDEKFDNGKKATLTSEHQRRSVSSFRMKVSTTRDENSGDLEMTILRGDHERCFFLTCQDVEISAFEDEQVGDPEVSVLAGKDEGCSGEGVLGVEVSFLGGEKETSDIDVVFLRGNHQSCLSFVVFGIDIDAFGEKKRDDRPVPFLTSCHQWCLAFFSNKVDICSFFDEGPDFLFVPSLTSDHEGCVALAIDSVVCWFWLFVFHRLFFEYLCGLSVCLWKIRYFF